MIQGCVILCPTEGAPSVVFSGAVNTCVMEAQKRAYALEEVGAVEILAVDLRKGVVWIDNGKRAFGSRKVAGEREVKRKRALVKAAGGPPQALKVARDKAAEAATAAATAEATAQEATAKAAASKQYAATLAKEADKLDTPPPKKTAPMKAGKSEPGS